MIIRYHVSVRIWGHAWSLDTYLIRNRRMILIFFSLVANRKISSLRAWLSRNLFRARVSISTASVDAGRKKKCRFAKSRRAFRPKTTRATVNSANSANCVIPKRVVDRLDRRAAPVVRRRAKKKIRVEGCGRSNPQGGGKRGGWCASTRVRTHTTFHASSAIPGTFFPKLAVVSRRGDYKAPRFLPARPDAIHNTCIPYLFRT